VVVVVVVVVVVMVVVVVSASPGFEPRALSAYPRLRGHH
jgi:uncharacterized membrane protein